MQHTEDFLQFAEEEVFPIGENRYSNLGILLVGLAIKHAYEKKFGPCDYNEILQQHLINQVGMPSFSPYPPKNAKYHKQDPVAAFIVGSPAGGYWSTAEDLAKFGQWILKQCNTDPELKRLMTQYGQEFYNAEQQTIAHSGGIQSSSAYLSASLKTGAVTSILSDEPNMAFDLNTMIQENVWMKPSSDLEEDVKEESSLVV